MLTKRQEQNNVPGYVRSVFCRGASCLRAVTVAFSSSLCRLTSCWVDELNATFVCFYLLVLFNNICC